MLPSLQVCANRGESGLWWLALCRGELLLQGGWDLGLVVLKGDGDFPVWGLSGGNTAGQRYEWGPPGASAFARCCALVTLKAWGWKEPT